MKYLFPPDLFENMQDQDLPGICSQSKNSFKTIQKKKHFVVYEEIVIPNDVAINFVTFIIKTYKKEHNY